MHANKVIRVHDAVIIRAREVQESKVRRRCVRAKAMTESNSRVDESVQGNGEVNVSVIVDVTVKPVEEEDGDVMVDMKEAQLSPLFAENDEKRVPKIPEEGRERE